MTENVIQPKRSLGRPKKYHNVEDKDQQMIDK